MLSDALTNTIRVTENLDSCLVYDRPLGPEGLAWADLVGWWQATGFAPAWASIQAAHKLLGVCLYASCADGPEKTMWRFCAQHYLTEASLAYPTLLPQFYLHYNPYSHLGRPTLSRQRMDFLLLLPNRARAVVIEIDGKQH